MSIQIRLADALEHPGGSYRYQVCGFEVCCDVSLAALAPFALDSTMPTSSLGRRSAGGLQSPEMMHYETAGIIGGRERRVVLRTEFDGARMDVNGLGRYALNPDGSVIALECAVPAATRALVEECTLGPPLILSLAIRGCWLFHAAAVGLQHGTVVIVGPSGAGKSTLAARLDDERSLCRIADDLVGLRIEQRCLNVMGGYPQLKLPAAAQSLLPATRLVGIFVLQPVSTREEFGIREMQGPEKLLVLAAHSVVARLFPPGLLRRHLAFCAMAASTGVAEITYPRTERAREQAVAAVKERGKAWYRRGPEGGLM